MKLNTIASTFLLSTFLVGGMATEVEAVTLPEPTTYSTSYTTTTRHYPVDEMGPLTDTEVDITVTFDGYYGALTIDDLPNYNSDRILNEDGTYTIVPTSNVAVIAEGSTVTYTASCEEYPYLERNFFLDGVSKSFGANENIPFDWVVPVGMLIWPSEDGTSITSNNNIRNIYTYTSVGDGQYRFFPTNGLTRLILPTGGEAHPVKNMSSACLYLDKILVIDQEGIDEIEQKGFAMFEAIEDSIHTDGFTESHTRTYPGLLEIFGGTTPAPRPAISDWAAPQLTFAQENNLTMDSLGYDYTKSITRSQIATLLVNMIEQYTGTEMPQASDDTFSDSSEEAVLKAYEAGIISGIGKKRFSPSATATRQEIAIMIVNAIKVLEENTGESFVDHSLTSVEGFSDFDTTADWAQNHVAILANNGIMTGSDGNLTPLSETSIQECLVLNNNLFKLGE